MALITTTTPNMIGGVSQQPPSLRLANQAEEQDNALGTITEGLKKRVNTEHLGLLASAPTSSITSEWHTIYRDATEKYAVAVSSNDVRIYDIANEGESENIYKPNGDGVVFGSSGSFGYLADCTAANANIEMLTLADYTLVLNKAVQPKMKAAVTTVRNPEALVFVTAGNYATEYKVTYKEGSSAGSVTYTTKDGAISANALDIQTDHIAAALHHGMTTSGGLSTGTYPGLVRTGDWPLSGYTLAIEGSCIWVQKDNTTAFQMKADDSVASTNLTVLQHEVQSFTGLPVVAPNGFVMKIDGLPEQGQTGFAAYYVAFRTTSDTTTGGPGTAAFEDGVWEEAVAPGIEYQLDPETMPHALIRLANGKFIWTPLDGTMTTNLGVPYQIPGWGDREAGDETTNGRVPWLQKSDGTEGEKIRGMSFFADRLVFLSGTDISLSEAGQYFSWFRTTVTSLLDSARISVTAAHSRVNLLNFAVPMREHLVVFSEFTQFSLRGSAEGTITPTNVWVTVATDYETSPHTKPVASKRSIFASAKRGTAVLIRELFDSGTGQRPQLDSVEVTAAVPTYIQGGGAAGLKMVVSTIEDMLVVLPRTLGEDSNKLFIFKYMINGDERIQSAWSRFIFDCDILSMDWIDQDLFLIMNRDGQVSLEKMDFESYLTDTDSDFRILLDRRLSDSSSGVGSSYTAGRTTFSLPYIQTPAATTQVVTRQSGATAAGKVLTLVSSTGTSVVVEGDHTSTPVWIGEKYDMTYKFSQLNLRSSHAQTANRAIVSAGSSLRMRYGTILFEDSGYFKVTVTPEDQTAYDYLMTGRILSSSNSPLGVMGIESGNFRFPLMGEHKKLTVEISSDAPFPARLISAEWEANYHTRNRRF